jgi:hypothetical protein
MHRGTRKSTTTLTDKRDYRLKYQYGITAKEYDELLGLQKGVCAICGRPPKTTRLHVDHKHQPKERALRKKKQQHLIRPNVRGLLCWGCNAAIQKFRDNPERMRAAARYLDNPPAKKVLDKQQEPWYNKDKKNKNEDLQSSKKRGRQRKG